MEDEKDLKKPTLKEIKESTRCPECKKFGLILVTFFGSKKKHVVCMKCMTRFSDKK